MSKRSFFGENMKPISHKGKLPKLFTTKWFNYLLLIPFLGMMIFRLTGSNDSQAISYVFVFMCSVSTTIDIIMGILAKPKSWCAICPIGTT